MLQLHSGRYVVNNCAQVKVAILYRLFVHNVFVHFVMCNTQKYKLQTASLAGLFRLYNLYYLCNYPRYLLNEQIFVMYVNLYKNRDPSHWQSRGVSE